MSAAISAYKYNMHLSSCGKSTSAFIQQSTQTARLDAREDDERQDMRKCWKVQM